MKNPFSDLLKAIVEKILDDINYMGIFEYLFWALP